MKYGTCTFLLVSASRSSLLPVPASRSLEQSSSRSFLGRISRAFELQVGREPFQGNYIAKICRRTSSARTAISPRDQCEPRSTSLLPNPTYQSTRHEPRTTTLLPNPTFLPNSPLVGSLVFKNRAEFLSRLAYPSFDSLGPTSEPFGYDRGLLAQPKFILIITVRSWLRTQYQYYIAFKWRDQHSQHI
jgi:hypothetical protein